MNKSIQVVIPEEEIRRLVTEHALKGLSEDLVTKIENVSHSNVQFMFDYEPLPGDDVDDIAAKVTFRLSKNS